MNLSISVGEFYTYTWLRKDGSPYYVGKGTWKNTPFYRQQRAYRKGSPSEDRIIIQTHATEDDAFFAERFLIAFYGRKDIGTGCLRNLTDGGEGLAGTVFTVEHRSKIAKSLSTSKKGKPIPHYDPSIHSKKMSGSGNPMWGKKRTFDAEWCRRLSLGKIGHSVTPETKAKIRAALERRRNNAAI